MMPYTSLYLNLYILILVIPAYAPFGVPCILAWALLRLCSAHPRRGRAAKGARAERIAIADDSVTYNKTASGQSTQCFNMPSHGLDMLLHVLHMRLYAFACMFMLLHAFTCNSHACTCLCIHFLYSDVFCLLICCAFCLWFLCEYILLYISVSPSCSPLVG